jgi:hypothetical protein
MMISHDSLQPNTFGSLFLELASCHKGEEVSCLKFRVLRVKVQGLGFQLGLDEMRV